MPERTWLDEYYEWFLVHGTETINNWLLEAAALDKETE
jgi:hypothetical protein